MQNDSNNQIPKCGWRVKEWSRAVGLGRSTVFELLATEKIKSMRWRGARIILTSPAEFLKNLEAA